MKRTFLGVLLASLFVAGSETAHSGLLLLAARQNNKPAQLSLLENYTLAHSWRFEEAGDGADRLDDANGATLTDVNVALTQGPGVYGYAGVSNNRTGSVGNTAAPVWGSYNCLSVWFRHADSAFAHFYITVGSRSLTNGEGYWTYNFFPSYVSVVSEPNDGYGYTWGSLSTTISATRWHHACIVWNYTAPPAPAVTLWTFLDGGLCFKIDNRTEGVGSLVDELYFSPSHCDVDEACVLTSSISWTDTAAAEVAQALKDNPGWLHTAHYDIQYAVNFIAGDGGTLSGDTSQTVDSGASCATVTASATAPWWFAKWTHGAEDYSLSPSITVDSVTENMTLLARFTRNWQVTFAAGPNGSLSGATTQTVEMGEDCAAVTAIPDAGHCFVNWTLDGTAWSTANPYTVTNVGFAMDLTANFASDSCTVTFQAESGGTLTGTTTQTVAYGSDCAAVTAVPNAGYYFVNWTGGGTTTANPLTVTNVTTNRTITAHFANTYTVAFVSGGGGSIFGTRTQTVAYGSDCAAVTAVPNTGYRFASWTGSMSSSDNPLTVTNVTADMTITANFVRTCVVTFRSGNIQAGYINGTTPQTVDFMGTCAPVTASAYSGYVFWRWTCDGTGYSTANPLTISGVTSDMSLVAEFVSQ